ncbi:MAG: hypothetical protein AAGC79_12970 [Pseudomonadota bacterium]
MDWVAMCVATVLIGAMTYGLVSDAAMSVAENGVLEAEASLALKADAKAVLVKSIEHQEEVVVIDNLDHQEHLVLLRE